MKAKVTKKIIGLTGSIASGKSTARKILEDLKHPTVCSDEIVHTLMKKNKPAYSKILKSFGATILDSQKNIDRQKLGAIVFENSKHLKKLEQILHPLVLKTIKNEIEKFKKNKKPFLFLEVPLLFETGFDKLCDETWCVYTTQKEQIERLKKRNGLTKNAALKRIRTQMPLKEKCKRSDFVLKNTNTIKDLKQKIQTRLSL